MCEVSIGIGVIFLSLSDESLRINRTGSVRKKDAIRSTSRANQILSLNQVSE